MGKKDNIMIYLCAILYLTSAFLMFCNINILTSLITNIDLNKKPNLFLYIYLVCSFMYYLVYIKFDYPIVDYILLLLCYLFLFLSIRKKYFTCKVKKIIYIIILYLSVSSIFHSILRFAVSLFYENYLDEYIKNGITLVVYSVFFIILDKVLHRTYKNVLFQMNMISNYVYILILLAIFFSGGLIEFQLSMANTQMQGILSKIFTIISIFLLIFIIGALVFNCISRAYFENVSSILEKQVNEQVDYYKKIDKIDKELRDFRHDYKNHMICVQSLLDAKEYDEAREYIQGITLHKTILSRGFSSGNSIADVLLSDKAECAEKIGAEIQFEGVIYENIPPADLCTILSNAIDNAIEACEKIQSNETKIILVKCNYIKHIQFIDITNPVAADVRISNNMVETSKSDKNIHGIGLYNIRRTLSKYEGEFNISCKDKTFVMSMAFKAD